MIKKKHTFYKVTKGPDNENVEIDELDEVTTVIIKSNPKKAPGNDLITRRVLREATINCFRAISQVHI